MPTVSETRYPYDRTKLVGMCMVWKWCNWNYRTAERERERRGLIDFNTFNEATGGDEILGQLAAEVREIRVSLLP